LRRRRSSALGRACEPGLPLTPQHQCQGAYHCCGHDQRRFRGSRHHGQERCGESRKGEGARLDDDLPEQVACVVAFGGRAREREGRGGRGNQRRQQGGKAHAERELGRASPGELRAHQPRAEEGGDHDDDRGDSIAPHEAGSAVHGAVEINLLFEALAFLSRGTALQGAESRLSAGQGVEREPRGDLRHALSAAANDHDLGQGEDRQHQGADEGVGMP